MILDKLKSVSRSFFLTLLVLAVLVLVASYFLSLFLGAALFFFTPDGVDFGLLYLQYIPIYLFTTLGFNAHVVINVGGFFRILWILFLVCLVAAWRYRRSLHQVIAESFSQPMGKLFDNCLFATPVITSMTFVAVVAITAFQKGVGIPTGDPPFSPNPFETLLWLSYAAVAEEVSFRVIPIGLFLVIYLLWAGQRKTGNLSLRTRLKLMVMAPLVPEEAKKLVGVDTVGEVGVRSGVRLGEWIMVLSTAIVFGLAHYLSGGGWEIGKISSSSLVGFVIGVAYLLYGVHATILLHWFFNYYFWFFFPDESGGLRLASKLNPGFHLAFELIELLILVIGTLGLLTLLTLGLRAMYSYHKKKMRAREMDPGLPLISTS